MCINIFSSKVNCNNVFHYIMKKKKLIKNKIKKSNILNYSCKYLNFHSPYNQKLKNLKLSDTIYQNAILLFTFFRSFFLPKCVFL